MVASNKLRRSRNRKTFDTSPEWLVKVRDAYVAKYHPKPVNTDNVDYLIKLLG